MTKLTGREKRMKAFGEYIAYSVIAVGFLVLATISFAICFGLLRLVSLL